MPEITIKYNNSKTLKLLKELSEYLDFSFSQPRKSKNQTINGVTIIPGDKSADVSNMGKVFTGRNIDAKKLRQAAWRRSK
jgi:hypothetical protein